ncbi:MAG: tetratricopeptide repeat protein [Planctomycetota bacterium]
MYRPARWLAVLTFVASIQLPPPVYAQSDSDRVNAEKYLQVLLRRPRPGVALDRVYGFHVQNDSLDELQAELTGDASREDAALRQMVWGLIQLNRGRGSEAAKALSLAEASLPGDAACSFFLGRALLANGQTEDAAAAMERAIDRGPSRSEALPMFTELGRIYGRAGQTEKSLGVWSRLEKLFPGDTKVGGQIARILADEGNIEEALRRFERLADTARRPDEKIAFAVQAAEMRRLMGEPDRALGELESILGRLRPGSWLYSDVRDRIEAGFLKSGDYDALADYYQQQLKQRPDDLTLQTRLSSILISAGRLAEAKTILEASVRRAPKDTDARLALIDLLVKQNSITEASKQFEELTKNEPENPDHLIRWGQLLLNNTQIPLEERRDGAVEVWSRLANSRSDDAVTLSQIADRMRAIQRSDEAIDLYRQSIQVDPSSPQYREYLGEYLHSLDRKQEAIEVWRQIASGDRKNRESLVRLAEVFGAFDEDSLALQTWEQAASYDLNFAEELRYAAKLVESKRYDMAFKRYDAAEAIAETPDEREQLLRDRIVAYQVSGTLEQQIAAIEAKPESPKNLRTLALLFGAAGDSASAEASITKALEADSGDADILLVAAEIAETQNRLVKAADLFEQLAAADSRFRSNYLQRVAALNVRIGRVDRAMEICESIIDANPASPESYQFLARTAFGVQRDEPAIAALRRAMSVAPRDNLPRRMLANHFADRFRTDEAIELYWQVFRYEAGIENKIGVIAALGPLYDRKSDMDALLNRIEELNRKEGDARTTALMKAAAYESIRDFGAARSAIEPLIATQPRDVALLSSMVRLSDAADEVEVAAEYQKRITELADTPENRFQLIQLQLEAGSIDITTALAQRISFVSDPGRLGGMVRSAVRRGDLTTARALCREAVKSDPSLWDLKLILAELLLSNRSSDTFEANRELAVRYAREVRDAALASDAKPPSRPTATRVSSTQSRPSVNQANPMYWTQSCQEIVRILRIGRYANYYSNSRSSLVEPQSFGHGRMIATALLLANESIGKSREELKDVFKRFYEDETAPGDIADITDPATLWERQALLSLESLITGVQPLGPLAVLGTTSSQTEAESYQKRALEITWRLAEVDTQFGAMQLISMLSSRQRAAQNLRTRPDLASRQVEPLSDGQLQTLLELSARNQKTPLPIFASQGVPAGVGQMMFQGLVATELSLAGKPELADSVMPGEVPEDADYWNLMSAVQFWLTLERPDRAEKLLARLLPAARQVQPTSMPMPPVIASVENDSHVEFRQQHIQTFVDSAIAMHVQRRSSTGRSSKKLGSGMLRGYVTMGNGVRRSVALNGPLSPRLLDDELAQSITSTVPQKSTDIGKVVLTDAVLSALEEPLEGASTEEQKTRFVLAAYAHWWADRPERCYESLESLCERYPSDVDLRIERARLASVLKKPRLALDTLDSFNPLDSKMLVRKEMAAMNLAAELGDIERAKIAAERLFGMRLDVQTQLALVDQLGRLGLKERADAMLQRTRSGRSRDAATQLQIANAFLARGDTDAAAEVAYALVRRLSTGRSQSNVASYQQQAVKILQTAGRLQPLIERAERRVESTPKAMRPKMELAELYTAAGRSEDANALWDALTKSNRVSTQLLMARAQALERSKKYDQAIDLYLNVFEKEPQRLSNDIYRLTNTVRRAGEASADKVFKRLLKIPIDSLPSYRLSELVRMGSRTNFSKTKRQYIGKVLRSAAGQSEIYNIGRYIDQNERKKIPEYRETLLDAACLPDAFASSSNLWQVRSRGSGGVANGPLADIITMLSGDPKAETSFRQAAEQSLQVESQTPGAEFLIALLNIKTGKAIPDELQKMRRLVAMGADRSDNTAVVSSGLLWQAGQILEEISDVPPEFLVDLYTEAKRSGTSVTSSTTASRTSVDNRLIKALVAANRPTEARQMLMKMYRETDNSERNQSNPGYGDYQDLQAYQWIGQQMLEMGGPIEAFTIFQTALADPDRFERAKRWGGSSGSRSTFEENAEKAKKEITADFAAKYVRGQLDVWEKELQPESIVLMDAPLARAADNKTPSIQLFLIEQAGNDSTGEFLNEFDARLQKIAEANPTSWRIPAMRWTAAHLLKVDITPSADQLFERLPNLDEIAVAGTPKSTRQIAQLLSLYPVAKVALTSDQEPERERGEALVRYLEDAAGALNDPVAGLALATLSGNTSTLTKRVLASLRAQVQPGRPASEQIVLRCLQLAEDTLKANDIESATEALTLALGSGPPLRKITTGPDPFALAQTTSRSNKTPDQIAAITSKLASVLEQLGKKTGVALSTMSPARAKSEVASKSAVPITQALLGLAMPPSRPGTFFPYAQPIASQQRDPFNSQSTIEVRSLSLALARAAAASHQSSSVFESLKARLNDSTDRHQIAAAMVQVAHACGDASMCDLALQELEASLDAKLPKVNQQMPKTKAMTSISAQAVAESQRKSSVVDVVMQATWPIVRESSAESKDRFSEFDRSIAPRLSTLLTRTQKLIQSDSYTLSRHRIISDRINKTLQRWAIASGDPLAIDRYIEGALAPPTNTPGGMKPEEYRRSELERSLLKLLGEGMLPRLDQGFRQVALFPKGDKNHTKRFEPQLCMILQTLAPEERYAFLEKITFGRSGKEPIAYLSGLVLYESPPPLVDDRQPSLSPAMKLPTGTDEFPVVNSLLLLIDAAIETQNLGTLTEKLRSQEESDAYLNDIIFSLIKVALAERDDKGGELLAPSIRPTLTAITEHLKQTRPAKVNAKAEFPELEVLLALRAARAGVPPQDIERILRDAKAFAIRGERDWLASAVSQATAKLGLGRAARGEPVSPLKHFHSVSLPPRFGVDTQTLPPLFAINKNGWVSGTSGYGTTHLMLKFPLTGTFEFSAKIRDGSWGESDVAYGGISYEAQGWNQSAKLVGVGSRGEVAFPVPSINRNKENIESVSVTPLDVQGMCNGKSYAQDVVTGSFPFASITQLPTRTTQFKDIRVTGSPTIPDEVQLVDPNMRGWGILARGRTIPLMLLPIGPKQNRKQIESFRERKAEELAKGPLPGSWSVVDGELHYKKQTRSNAYDPSTQIQYMRPLQKGESITIEYWSESGLFDLAPSLGRLCLKFTDREVVPIWIPCAADLAATSPIPGSRTKQSTTSPVPKSFSTDIEIKDKDWNTLVMKRSGDSVAIRVNDKPMIEVPIRGHERPGIYRIDENVRVRSILLRGDNWPKEVPSDLMATE